jgi:2-polyprenyl-3-methyl-5-hydroxy-6-metoxy-1,4-benzoquinol methylase
LRAIFTLNYERQRRWCGKELMQSRDTVEYGKVCRETVYNYSKSEYDRMAQRYRYNFRGVLPKDKTALILDVGSAGGFFLYFMRNEGFENARGIDADPEAVTASKKFDLPIEQADAFDYLAKCRSTFDCITINQVLEHFPREISLSLLSLIFDALRPGGCVIASVPNGLNPAVGHLMYSDLSHDHLYTPKSLGDSLAVVGFDEIAIYPEGPAPYDLLTRIRWVLWKLRELALKALFVIDIGVGRSNPLQCIFTYSIIATGRKP